MPRIRSAAAAAATLIWIGGCAFMQPHRRGNGAAIADTVGAVLFVAGAASATQIYSANNSGAPFYQDSLTTGIVVALGAVGLLYTASAIFGFSRDNSMQVNDEPILGLQILALGLAGAGGGARSGSDLADWRQGADNQGCCSWHGGADYCYGGRVVCKDETLSRNCSC